MAVVITHKIGLFYLMVVALINGVVISKGTFRLTDGLLKAVI